MTNLFEATQDPPDASLREEILNKWKDKPVEELLKAKVESDLYIKSLERQKDELRTDYLKQRDELLTKAKFEEYLQRMENKDVQVTDTQVKEVSEPKYDPKEIESLILNKINETKKVEKETDNFNRVQSKLQERFGNNYQSVIREQQLNLGLSDNDVNELAKKSPEAFFRMMNLNQDKQDSFQTPPRNNQRMDNFAPKVQKRDYAYYQGLKKTNPRLYLDPKISVQMHNDAVEQGEAFFG